MYRKYFYIIFIYFLAITGCKSLLNTSEPGFTPSESLETLSVPDTQLKNNLDTNLEDKYSREAESLIKAKEADLSLYYENYLDSLRIKLKDSGAVRIKGYEGFLVNILSDQVKGDTIYLANLVTETNNKGVPLSFQYSALKNDRFYFEIECIKNNALSELIYGGVDIEFIEGGEVRFQHFDLNKKDKIKGSFKVLEDNPIVFNVTKGGFFKGALKVNVKKTLGSKLIVEKIKDSIEDTRMVVKEVADTIYHLIDEKQYTLAPRLDLTNIHQLKMPLIVEELDNVLGWAFWVGLTKSDRDEYVKLNELIMDEPLMQFAKAELMKVTSFFQLPQTLDDNIVVDFQKKSNDVSSLNSTETYSFFKSDSLSPVYKGELRITNQSKIYDFLVTVKMVGVNIVKSRVEVEETTYRLSEYFNISVLK